MTMTPERLAELDAVMAKAREFPFATVEWEVAFTVARLAAYNAIPDLRAHIEAQAATIAGLREALAVIRAKDTRAEFFASTSGKTQRRVAGPYAKIARAALTGAA